jgi:hypothetical protein
LEFIVLATVSANAQANQPRSVLSAADTELPVGAIQLCLYRSDLDPHSCGDLLVVLVSYRE